MRSRLPGGDAGTAVLEFVALAVLLLVPVVHLVVAVGRVQAAAFAVEGSAREAARTFVRAPDVATGTARARTAARLGLEDQGFDGVPDPVRIRCLDDPCLGPDARVAAEVELEVVLPGAPALVDSVVPVRVPVRAVHVATVDRFAAGAAP